MIDKKLKQVVLFGGSPTPTPTLLAFGTESTLDRCGFYRCAYQRGAIEAPLDQVWHSVRITQSFASWVVFAEAMLCSDIAREVVPHQYLDEPSSIVSGACNLLVETSLADVRHSRAHRSHRHNDGPVYSSAKRAKYQRALKLQQRRYLERVAGLSAPVSTNPIQTLMKDRAHTPIVFGHWGLQYRPAEQDIELWPVSQRWDRDYPTTTGMTVSGKEAAFPLIAAELACEIAAYFLRDRAIVELLNSLHYRPWLIVRADRSAWVAGKLAAWEEENLLPAASEPDTGPEESESEVVEPEVPEESVGPVELFNQQPVPLRLLSVATLLSELLADPAAEEVLPEGDAHSKILRQELEALLAEEECVALDHQLQSLRETISKLETECAAADAAVEERIRHEWANEKEDERIAAQVADLRADEAALASTITTDSEALSPLRSEVVELRNELEALRRRKRQLDTERDRLLTADSKSRSA